MTDPAWEERLAAVWAAAGELEDDELRRRVESLADELGPGDAVALFERAGSWDSTARSDLAVPLYREALAAGLSGTRRRRAVIQLASSLRNLGEVEESVALLREELDEGSDELDDAVCAFLALALADAGQEREAVSRALTALAPHLPRYQRSLAEYARQLIEP